MKILKISVLIFTIFIFTSCEEDFNPFGDYQESYVFNCVLRGDTALQAATVAKTYNSGFDALSNTEDPFLKGADIRIWFGDSVYLFSDTSITRDDTSRYNTPFNLYKCEKFLVEYNQTIEAEIMLPNGRRLRSSIITPAKTLFESSSATTIPAGTNSTFRIGWTNSTSSIYFLPAFSIIYYKNQGNQQVQYTKEVPAYYDNETPVYFTPVRQTSVTLKIETLVKALEEISGEDDKSKYTIKLSPVFKVAAFDESLSRYYSVTSQTFDHLTVRVDENDYTNIEGGFGIFGAFTSTKYQNLKLYGSYITSLGYKITD
jgi:hypothetical protein